MASLRSFFRLLDSTSINQFVKGSQSNGSALFLSKSCASSPEALIALYNLRGNIISGHVKRKYVYTKNGGDVKSIIKAFGRKLDGGLGAVVSIGLTAVCMVSPKYVVHAYFSPETNEIDINISKNELPQTKKPAPSPYSGVILSVHGVHDRAKSLQFYGLAKRAIVGGAKNISGHSFGGIQELDCEVNCSLHENENGEAKHVEKHTLPMESDDIEVEVQLEENMSADEIVNPDELEERIHDNSSFAEKCAKLTMLIVVYDVILLSTYYTCKFVFSS